MMRTSVLALTFLFLPAVSYAVTESALKKGLADYSQEAKALKTPADYLKALKNKIPAATYAYLEAEAKGHENEILPSVKTGGGDRVTFSDGRMSVSFQVVAGAPEAFKINNHYVDLSDCKDMNERWKKVIAALPAANMHGFFLRFVLPSAYADDVVRNGGLGVGIGGTGILAATLNVWNPYGWAVIFAGAAIWASGVNQDVAKDLLDCLSLKENLDEVMEKNPENAAALKNKKPRPECAKGDKAILSKAEVKETRESLRALVAGQSEVTRYIARGSDWLVGTDGNFKDLNKCMHEVAPMAHYLCLNMFNYTDGLLEAWMKTPAKPKEIETSNAEH